jgi:hypothetical protein
MEYGDIPKEVGRPKNSIINTIQYKCIIDIAREGKVEEAKELAIETIPDKYLLYKSSIDNAIEQFA